MIRPAVGADVPQIVAMSHLFYQTTNYRYFAAMCADTVENLVNDLMERGIMLVAQDENEAGRIVGMAGLYIGPFLFNRDKKGAYEVVWYVSQDTRAKGVGSALLKAIDTAAIEKECDIIQMVTLSTSPVEAGKIYETMGYTHSETSYTKVL